MRHLLLPAVATLVLTASASPARSELLYDNGPPDQKNGSEMTEYVEADDFELTEPTRLDRVAFWNFERDNTFSGSFSWEIYRNSDSNSPGTPVVSGTSTNLSHAPTGFAIFGGMKEYLNTFDVGPVILPPGIYWLALHNGPFTNVLPPRSVYWEATSNVGERPSHGAVVLPIGRQWFSNSFPTLPSELAFYVNGVALPRITALAVNNGTARISFTTVTGESYSVQYANSPAGAAWATLPGAESVPGTGGVVEVADPQPNVRSLPRRFYRVLLL